MASISQTIPYYIQGISEQPDTLKKHGQVRDALNVVPDITSGLVKRPGTHQIRNISAKKAGGADVDMNAEAAWFAIDQTDKYIGRVEKDGTYAVWQTSNGDSIPVEYTADNTPGGCGCSSKYLVHTDPESIQFLSINDHTFVVNREKTVSTLAVGNCRYASSSYPQYSNPNYGHPYEAFIDLKSIVGGQQYPLDIFSASPGGAVSNTRATKLTATWVDASGVQRNMKISNIGSTKYTYTKTFDINPSPTPTGGSIHSGTNTTQRNLRFKLQMTGMPYSEGTKYHSIYRLEIDLLHGGYGWKVGDNFIVSMGDTGSIGYYRITVTETRPWSTTADIGIVRPMPTPSTPEYAVTADGVLEQLKAEINTKTSNFFTITKIGNGLHLTPASAGISACRTTVQFNITTSENAVMNILTNEVTDVSKLPTHCKDGYLVKVSNTEQDEDDYWLKFVSDTAGKDGRGHWEETWDPCVEIDFDPCTMPHKIVRLPSGGGYKFDLQTIDWEQRKVGDEKSNPMPSFVGKKISNMAFFRNRLGFFAEENVIFSQSGDFYNFFADSAIALADSDAIDISASSTRPTILYDSVEVNQGLLVFSPHEQFLVSTDTDRFAPGHAKVNYISAHDYNIGLKPLNLGNSVGFTSNSGRSGRFWQLGGITRGGEGSPTLVEQSKALGDLLPNNLLTAAASRDNNIILFTGWDTGGGSYGTCPDPYDTVWGYRYFSDGERLVQSAWFRWKFYGKVLWHTIMDNSYYVIQFYNNQAHLQVADLSIQTGTQILDDQGTCDKHLVHMDNIFYVEMNAYDATTNLTSFTLPESHKRQPATHGQTTGGSQVVYGLEGGLKGEPITVEPFTANSTSTGYVQGNWMSTNAVIGFTYDMQVDFPSIYMTKNVGNEVLSDQAASLTVHRSKFNFGPTGYYSTILERKGRSDFIIDYTSNSDHTFLPNTYHINLESQATVPIYANNKDFRLKLSATHPTPCTLYSQTWEGSYTPNYYQRG
tara:strand:- start:1207 stop:4176 length:2970 start_codon:yes stop_codon:yes gene_type:complete